MYSPLLFLIISLFNLFCIFCQGLWRGCARGFSSSTMRQAQPLTVRDALNTALDEEMEKDEKVCGFGYKILEGHVIPHLSLA